jgi:hypothetical protein
VDEPVTSDIKRLIRLPCSLHGKTGLRVVKMTREELDGFEPLRDAVPPGLGDAPVRLLMAKRMEVRLRGERFSLEGEVEVPEFAALPHARTQFTEAGQMANTTSEARLLNVGRQVARFAFLHNSQRALDFLREWEQLVSNPGGALVVPS